MTVCITTRARFAVEFGSKVAFFLWVLHDTWWSRVSIA